MSAGWPGAERIGLGLALPGLEWARDLWIWIPRGLSSAGPQQVPAGPSLVPLGAPRAVGRQSRRRLMARLSAAHLLLLVFWWEPGIEPPYLRHLLPARRARSAPAIERNFSLLELDLACRRHNWI